MIPYQSWMLGLAETWAGVTGEPLNFGMMGVMTFICTVLILSLYVITTKFVFKVDYSTMEEFDVNKLGEESKHLTPRTKRIIIVYLITVIVVIWAILSRVLPWPTSSTTPCGGRCVLPVYRHPAHPPQRRGGRQGLYRL